MKFMRMKARSARMLAMLLVLILSACPAGLAAQSAMPFNGEIAFHKITLTIPGNYVRDSTQSTADFWVFEKGFYSKCIMLSRNDAQDNAEARLDSYMEYLQEQGVNSQRTTFLQLEAVRSEALQEEKEWCEMLFAHDGSLYAVAMRGGSEEEFLMLLDTVAVHDEVPKINVQPDDRTAFGRFFGYFFGK